MVANIFKEVFHEAKLYILIFVISFEGSAQSWFLNKPNEINYWPLLNVEVFGTFWFLFVTKLL